MVSNKGSLSLHQIAAGDDVATALEDLRKGHRIEIDSDVFIARSDIPRGHKIAVKAITAGQAVIKYGFPIGRATADIHVGDHVHTHNVGTGLAGLEGYVWQASPPSVAHEGSDRTFQGYRRKNGKVGTRNEIWILCTVGCVANTARRLADLARERFADRIDGIHAFPHPFGCSQLGDDLDHSRALIASLASHPNAGGVLLVGLGCENNQLSALIDSVPDIDADRLRAFTTQMVADEYEAGLAAIEELVDSMADDRRVPSPLSDLVLGLKCGGSDGFSGMTANPLVGLVADLVAEAGGTPILSEIPEIFGAERLLMARAVSEQVFDRTVAVVNDFKSYFLRHDQPIYENPSPDNIQGGITTLEEKSLGAVQKAGHSPLVDVLRYGERVAKRGLNLLEAPGNDAVSATALSAAGATIILFTTGRGTPTGFPSPTIKIASNSDLATRKANWIDFDAGPIATGEAPDISAGRLLDLVIATASGRPTRAEINGEHEIAIWKDGVTL